MQTRSTILALIATILLLGGLGATRARGAEGGEFDPSVTQIRLRATVRVAPDLSLLTLADIADINGPQADALKPLTIVTSTPIVAGKWTLIPVDSIRALIQESKTINDGSLIIIGHHDIAITRRSVFNGAQSPAARKNIANPASAAPILKDHLERWVYARLKSDASTTRIQYNQRDQALLSTPTTGRIVEISANGRSEQMSVRIVIYENEQILKDASIRFDVQTLRRVRIVTSQIMRKDLIDSSRTRLDTRWISPLSPIADPQTSLGQVSKTTANPGSILMNAMLESPVIIHRGEIISAKSLAGTVAVSLKVRALSSGKVGELIKLESRDRKQKFTARVAGPGQVVIVQKPITTSTASQTTQGSP